MQANRDSSDLWQLDAEFINRVCFELWKHERLELSKLLEAWKAKPAFLKGFPSVMQSSNRRLQPLRMHVCEFCPGLFEFG